MLNDYECEIKYHPGKANVVADALIRKERVKPLRVGALGLTIATYLTDRIREAQGNDLKPENVAVERLQGMVDHLEAKSDGTLYL